METNFNMKTSLVNNDTVYGQQKRVEVGAADAFQDMSLEVVEYLILERAVVDTTGGAL